MNKYSKFLPRRPLFLVCLITVISSAIYICIVPDVMIDYSLQEGQRVEVIGQVKKIENKNLKNILYLKNVSFRDKQNSTKTYGVVCYLAEGCRLPEYGSKIICTGKFSKFSKASNPGQFDFNKYYLSIGYNFSIRDALISEKSEKYSVLKEKLHQIKLHEEYLLEKIMTSEDAGIIKAMILGDKTDMAKDIKTLYQQNGIAHILAISGLHVSIIGLLVYTILDKLGINRYIKVIISCLILVFYGIMTGNSIGLVRASVMYIARLMAIITKRTYDVLTALALAAAIICLDNPYVLYNGGFYLSFTAVLGAVVFSKYFLAPKKQNDSNSIFIKIKKYILDSVSLGFAVNIITLPVITYLYYEIPIYSGALNLIVIPFMTVLLCNAIIALIIANFSLTVGSIVAIPCHFILKMYEKMCVIAGQLPYSSIITGRMYLPLMICYYLICLLIVYFEYLLIYRTAIFENNKNRNIKWIIKNKKLIKTGLMLILIFSVKIRFPEANLTMLDVGQGDCFCISNGKFTCMMDGGSTSNKDVASNVIEPYLKSQGISTIDCWFISHPDEDHCSGLIQMMDEEKMSIKVNTIVLPDAFTIKEDALEIINKALEKNIPIVYISKGDKLEYGKALFECINPSEKYQCEDINEYSLVMILTLNNKKVLFTGDASAESEERYIEYLPERIDILKVAHHGSSTATSEKLLKKIKTDISLISSGINNRYGHPHKEIIQRLENAGTKIIRTDRNGAVQLYFSKRKNKITIKKGN